MTGKSSRPLPPTNTDVIKTTVQVGKTYDDTIADQRYVGDTTSNANSLNVDRSGGMIKALQGYAAGSTVVVTYYHNMDALTTERAVDNDYSASLASSHKALLKINNFEIKLPNGFTFNFSPEQVVSEITGTAMVYAGFEPSIGDTFLYTIDQGKYGLFRVNKAPKRMSIRNGTCHEIEYDLYLFPDLAEIQNLEAGVREVAWFIKDRFLLDDGALVTSDEMAIMGQLTDKISEVTTYYLSEFLDTATYNSYMRKDEIYDPYVTDFMMSVVEFSETHVRPQKLLADVSYPQYSFWAKLKNPKGVPFTTYKTTAVTETLKLTALSTKLTALINRDYIKLVKADDPDYPNSRKYTYGCYTHMDTLVDGERDDRGTYKELIHEYWITQNIKADLLLTLMTEYTTLSELEQFYIIPVYLYLAKLVVNGVQYGDGDVRFQYTNTNA